MDKFKKLITMIAVENNPLSMDLLDENADMSILFNNDEPNTEESTEETTDIDPDNIFTEEESLENVGKEEVEESHQNSGSISSESESPSNISSILTALKEDGILPDVDVKLIKSAKTPEDFASVIDAQVNARLEYTQKRIKEALDVGVQPDEILQYEQTIGYLNTISEESILEETEEADVIRKNLIYQDYLNRGLSPERAKREIEKSIAAGTEIEDAKAALEGNKEFFTKQYETTLAARKENDMKIKEEQKKAKEEFTKLVNDTAEPFEGLILDPKTRRDILNNATKLVEKDAKGNYSTPLQKYIKENPNEAQYYMSMFYTLTDGFKNLDKLVKGKVTKSTNKTVSNIERVLNTSSNFSDSGNSLFPKDENSKLFEFKVDI